MNSEFLWELFLDTGSPEIYLLYKRVTQTAEAASA